MNGLNEFVDETIRLVEDAERQYGVANATYTEYFIERLEICIVSCVELRDVLEDVNQVEMSLRDYCATVNQLIGCLRNVFCTWLEYEDLLESFPVRSLAYQAPVLRRRHYGAGRPAFYISKDQLVYLNSLCFNWTDVAAILNVSRMTIYRQVDSASQ